MYVFAEKEQTLFFPVENNKTHSLVSALLKGKWSAYKIFYLKREKCNSGDHSHRCRRMPRHIFTDHCKETDYIVSLVWSTSGLVFSLASLRWIRKECLARFLLSLWCFQVIVHTSHPFTLVAPSGMP